MSRKNQWLSAWCGSSLPALTSAIGTPARITFKVSSGGVSSKQKIPLGPGYQVHLARAIRNATSMPTMAVGLITDAAQAEAMVAAHDADLVAMARALLWDPHWPWHAAATLGAQVQVPKPYWRSAPRDAGDVLAYAKIGMR